MQQKRQNVVLVHGAFADGSSFAPIIQHLQAKGVNAIAVQNPLSTLAEEIKAVNAVLDTLEGDVLLVGHSWAGVVISAAGNHEKVKKLLYLSAIVPNSQESAAEALNRLNAPMEGLKSDNYGFIRLPSAEMYQQVMAGDLPLEQVKLLYAVQQPIAQTIFSERIAQAAWQTKASYYFLTEEDNALPFAVQNQFAQQINARTKSLKASHLAILSHPQIVAEWIVEVLESRGDL